MIGSSLQMETIEIANTILNVIFTALSIVLIILPLARKIMHKLFCMYLCPDTIRKEDFLRYTRIFVPTRLVRYHNKGEEEHLTLHSFAKLMLRYSHQYIFVLGDAGTGKTTFLLNLYLYLRRRLFRYKVAYVALRCNDALSRISKLGKKRDTILLLDGFDEAYEVGLSFSEHLIHIEDYTKDFYRVIITSRKHYFDSISDEPDPVHINRAASSSIVRYHRYEIECFNDEDAKKYLIKKYKYNITKRIRAQQVIDGIPNMMARPMLLTFIDDLIDHKLNYNSSYDIYTCMINKWIQREVRFIYSSLLSHKVRNQLQDPSDIHKSYWNFADDISIVMYKDRKYCISASMLRQCAEQCNIDLRLSKRGRSLLTRINDYEFSFFHRTILEYFISSNYKYIDNFIVYPNFDMIYQFIIECRSADETMEKQMHFYLHCLISDNYISSNVIAIDNFLFYPIVGELAVERIGYIKMTLEKVLNRDLFEQKRESLCCIHFTNTSMILRRKIVQFEYYQLMRLTTDDIRFLYPWTSISDYAQYENKHKKMLPYLSRDVNYVALEYSISSIYKRLYYGFITNPTDIMV